MDTQAVHAIAPTGENDIVLNCMIQQSYFNRQFLERLTNSGPVAQFLATALGNHAHHDQYLLFHTSQNPMIRELFENAFCEYLEPGICSKDLMDSYMIQIFIHLARCYQKTKEQEYRRQDRNYLTEILRYIEENYTDCTLETTAKQFNFNPTHLSRTLKKNTGFTFKELVDQTRLRQAAFLLKNSDISIADIAAECGWSNLNQFYKKFTAEYGKMPRQYRDEHHKCIKYRS